MRKYTNYILGTVLIILLILLINSIHSFSTFLFSTNGNIDKTELLGRIIPPLLGAFFSGIVAILIFYLTKLKEEFTKKSQSKMFLQIIENEIDENLKSVNKISDILNTTPSIELAKKLTESKKTQEQFKVICSNLSTEIIEKFLVQLNKKDYLDIANQYKKFKLLIQSLEMLNNDVNDEENKTILIERIKLIFKFFTTENQTKHIEEKNDNHFVNNLLIMFLYLIVNIFIFKFLL